jgi:hypothetical protein
MLNILEEIHGPQKALWPVDPYEFLVWNYCAYPASDAKCAKGWVSLQENVGVEPERILACNAATLAHTLKSGGMFPEERAMRLKETADRVIGEFAAISQACCADCLSPKPAPFCRAFMGLPIRVPTASSFSLVSRLSPPCRPTARISPRECFEAAKVKITTATTQTPSRRSKPKSRLH